MAYEIEDEGTKIVDPPWADDRTQMPGTEDFVHVASHVTHDYEWADFHAWYAPTARRFFWDGQTGCSCYSWEVENIGDLKDGNRDDLLRSFRAWVSDKGGAKYYGVDPTEVSTAIRDFRIPS